MLTSSLLVLHISSKVTSLLCALQRLAKGISSSTCFTLLHILKVTFPPAEVRAARPQQPHLLLPAPEVHLHLGLHQVYRPEHLLQPPAPGPEEDLYRINPRIVQRVRSSLTRDMDLGNL